MKKFYTLLLFVFIGAYAHAQLNGNGYYRVKNYGTGNYIWVCDNTGSINYAATTADMGAVQLWEGLDLATSEPASVLYFTGKGGKVWNISAQGTSIYDIIDHNIEITDLGVSNGLHFYEVSASQAGLTLYLADVGTWGGDYNVLGTNSNVDKKCRRWLIEPIDANTDNYFGVTPSITIGSKHYAPFYAAFPFSFASTGMKAYYISKLDGNIAVLKEITSEVIPASTPVIIECSSADKSKNRLNVLNTNQAAIADNQLKGVYFCNEFRESSKQAITVFDATKMRAWSVKDGKLTLSTDNSSLHINWWGDDGKRYLNANQSYLPVPAGSVADFTIMTEAEYEAMKAGTPGDLNGDGKITTNDATIVTNYAIGVSTDIDKNIADMNGDGKITTNDATLIIKQALQ